MKILITGSKGFIAQNLIQRLKQNEKNKLICLNKKTSIKSLKKNILESDVVFHLAGKNRSDDSKLFYLDNYIYTKKICHILKNCEKNIKIIYASSIHAVKKTHYGVSKLKAEKELFNLKKINKNVQVIIFRLPNVFGKWSKPFYNSVVATLCYQISRKKKFTILNKKKLTLVYIDDLVNYFIKIIKQKKIRPSFHQVLPQYKISLDKLTNIINNFRFIETANIEKLATGLVKKLYSTYLSFTPVTKKFLNIKINTDMRGEFIEFAKSQNLGQVSVVSIFPKKMRGNHYHNTKIERFLVLSGKVKFNFINIITKKKYSIVCDEKKPKIVITKPGWAHNIANIGTKKASVLIWCNEVFDKKNADTYSYNL